jgi:hypothetical protein
MISATRSVDSYMGPVEGVENHPSQRQGTSRSCASLDHRWIDFHALQIRKSRFDDR